MINNMVCNVCSSSTTLIGSATILQKHKIKYFECDHCGFIQTEKPYWLSEAYSETIARSDIGLIDRNIKNSNISAAMISVFFNCNGRFLDYGGGNGMFVRLMRDKGFNFYWEDLYTANQFAQGFESKDEDKYELVTAYEVFEHLEDPINEIKKILSYSDNILFSTTLIPANNPLPEDWWYFALDSGQHISLYSKQSLNELAQKFNLHLYSNGKSLHLFSRKKIPRLLFFLFSIRQLAGIFMFLFSIGRKSLQENDYFNITGKKLN